MKRYKKGYTPSCNIPRDFFDISFKTQILNWLYMFVYIISIPASILPSYFFYLKQQYGVSLLCYLLTALFVARQIRGLENMVHDASHLTWLRKSKKWNNILTTFTLGSPVLSDVSAYSNSHDIHHKSFASSKDPCWVRLNNMGVANIDLSTKYKIITSVLRWLPLYNLEYYKEIGSKNIFVIIRFISWHFIIYLLPMAAIFGFQTSFFLWIFYFFIPLTVTLPCVRSIAEVEEHDYHRETTEFLTTYNNVGIMHHLLFHPFRDSYHLIHHMFPTISVHKHKKLHHFLLKNDIFYAQQQLSRHKVLEKI